MAGVDEKMNYLEAIECYLQEYVFENDKTNGLHDRKFHALEFPGTDFVSAFRVKGIPILPPLMTESRRQKMRTFKQQAVLREIARQKKLNFRVSTKDTASAKSDDMMEFHGPGQVENEEGESRFRGMTNEDARQRLANMEFKDISGSYVSSCHLNINHLTSDTKFTADDDRHLADPMVEFGKQKISPGKLQTSTEEPKSKGPYLRNQYVKNDLTKFVTTDRHSSNNGISCDSQTFRDSGTHSMFSSAVDESNSSGVTVLMNRARQRVDCSHPKSSVDSGLYSKELTTVTSDSAVNHDESETLDEESYLTSNEDLDRSDNSILEAQPSISVKSSSICSERSLPIGDDDESCLALDTVPDEQDSFRNDLYTYGNPLDMCNEKKLKAQLTMEEQMTFDDFMTSKGSVGSTFSGESNELIRTVIDCQDSAVPSSDAGAELSGKKMLHCAIGNDSCRIEYGEQTSEMNQELSDCTAENCLMSADNSVAGNLSSQHLDEVCSGFTNDFKLHVEKDDETENEDVKNFQKVEEERDVEEDNVGIDVGVDNEEERVTQEQKQEKREDAQVIQISDCGNSEEITHFNEVEEKLKESEDDLGNDLNLNQQLIPERNFEQEKDNKHELSAVKLVEKETQLQEMALACLTDDKEKKHCMETRSESKLENSVKLKQVMEQGKELNEEMTDNAAEPKQNAEGEEQRNTVIEDKMEQRNDHVEMDTGVNGEGLLSDKTHENFDVERKPVNDLEDEPLPSPISLEKKVAQVLGKLDKYHDIQAVYMESNLLLSTSDPALILQTTVVSQADISVSSELLADSHVMPDLQPTFSANTELAPYLVSLLTGDTIENCMTRILVDHDSNQFPVDYFGHENIQNHESESGIEPVLHPARLRRDSYVISSPEVSQITENECPTGDGMRRIRRGSYTLENPSETLQSAEVRLYTDPDKFSSIMTTDGNGCLPSTETPPKMRVNSLGPLLVGEAEQLLSTKTPPQDDGFNSEAVAMAAKRARIKSEQVGKLEHLRRYLQQVSDMETMESPSSRGIQRDAHDEMNCMNRRTASDEVHHHLGQVNPRGVKVAPCSHRGVNSEVYGLGDGELDDRSSCDVPVYMNEEDVQKEFNHKISQIKEKHQRDLARLIAGQQLVLQREILLHEQQLGQRNMRTKKVRSSKQPGNSSRNAVEYQRSNVNADVMVDCDRSRCALNCSGDGVGSHSVYTVDQHSLTGRSASAVALDCGDSHMIQSSAIAPIYFEERRVVSPAVSLATLQSEDNESEFAFKSPAVLRQAKSVHSSCSPKAPMYSSPALRHRTSQSEMPSSGGNAEKSLMAEPANDNAKVSSDVSNKLESLPALVKGYLTRRLMKTERVQSVIQTIQDTAMFALHFQLESPMKKGFYSMQDRQLHERVLAQLTAAMYEIHEIFFEISTKERMTIISQSRALRKEKLFKETRSSVDKKKRISAATLKSMERKRKAVQMEACAKHQSVKPASKDNNRKSTTDRMTSVGTACQTKLQNDVRPVRSQSSPRNTGKENVHRILGKEKTRVVAANMSNKPKMQGCNVKILKKTTSVAPARKVARKTNKPNEDHAAVKQLNCYNNDIAQVRPKSIHDKQHLNLHQKDEALMSNNHPKLSPKGNPNYWLNPQVGEVLYDSPTNSLNGSQENVSGMMTSYQRHTVRSYSIQEKDTMRKIAGVHVQSRLS